MATLTSSFEGGQRMSAALGALQQSLGRARNLRVGFLENAKYPEGDAGARLRRRARDLTPGQRSGHPDWHPKLLAWANWQRKNPRDLHVATVAFWNEFGTTTAPARPFFRNMIRSNSGTWGASLVRYLQASGNHADRALRMLGVDIAEQLRESIRTWPADNAALTVYIKGGSNHGLVDSAVMMRSVDFEVSE